MSALEKHIDNNLRNIDFATKQDLEIMLIKIENKFNTLSFEIEKRFNKSDIEINSIKIDLSWHWRILLGIGSLCAYPILQKLWTVIPSLPK